VQQIFNNIKKIEQFSEGKFITSKWVDWFIFGTYCNIKKRDETAHDIISQLSNASSDDVSRIIDLYMIEEQTVSAIQNCNYLAISHYIAINNVSVPKKSYITKANIAKYQAGVLPNEQNGDNLAMQFHTDYRLGEWYWPQQNFLLTCTTYLNDNYDGGEIIFCVGDNYIPYKPSSGDVLVFPSGSPLFPEYPNRQPYFHATNSVKKNDKYFVRNYVTYDCNGEDLWFSNLEKYGEDWIEMAKKRSSGHNLIAVKDEDGNTFDLEKYFPGKKLTKYGSNLIPKFYDVKDDEYLFYDEIYKYEI
jgi:hypothetical protein